MTKAVVYDCDGVIVDSGDVILSYYNWMMAKCGLPPIDWSEDEMRLAALSLADKDILETLSKGDEELYQKMLRIAKTETNDPDYDKMSLETGLPQGFDIVKGIGLPMAVLTNRGKSLITLLDYFGVTGYFSKLVTAADTEKPKPSPEGLLKICDHFGVLPAELLFIGDSPTDYYAAKACGAPFIAFKKPLWDAPVINDHREVKVFLK